MGTGSLTWTRHLIEAIEQAHACIGALESEQARDRTDLLDEGMRDLLRWLADRAITPPPVTTYPLAEVARAHADIESGRTIGKLVLVP